MQDGHGPYEYYGGNTVGVCLSLPCFELTCLLNERVGSFSQPFLRYPDLVRKTLLKGMPLLKWQLRGEFVIFSQPDL